MSTHKGQIYDLVFGDQKVDDDGHQIQQRASPKPSQDGSATEKTAAAESAANDPAAAKEVNPSAAKETSSSRPVKKPVSKPRAKKPTKPDSEEGKPPLHDSL